MDTALQLINGNPISQEVDLEENYLASYRGAIEHFIDCLSSGAPFETSPADNLETLKLVENAYALGR
jgi:predicted dehydrogenase